MAGFIPEYFRLVGKYGCDGFDGQGKGGFGGGGFVVYDTVDSSFVSCRDGNDHPSVPDGYGALFFRPSFGLGLLQEGLHPSGDAGLFFYQLVPDVCQFGRGVVFDIAVFGDDGVQALQYVRKESD